VKQNKAVHNPVMDAHTLKAWLKARRGRASALALLLNVSKAYIYQLSSGKRTIPPQTRPLIEQEIRRSRLQGEPQAARKASARPRKAPEQAAS